MIGDVWRNKYESIFCTTFIDEFPKLQNILDGDRRCNGCRCKYFRVRSVPAK